MAPSPAANISRVTAQLTTMAIACSTAFSTLAWAGTEGLPGSDGAELKEMVVTATRREIAVSDAPANVTVIKAEDMEKRRVGRIGDALGETPSLFMRGSPMGDNAPGGGMGGLTLRGATAKSGRTAVMLDGVILNSSYAGNVNWSTIYTEDTARIEVVPGTFSSLYGSNAIGGVINVITKRPTREEAVANLSYGWGPSESNSLNASYRNKLSNGLGFMLGMGARNNNGYPIDFAVKGVAGTGTVPVTGGIPTSRFTGSTTTADGFYSPAYIIGDKGDRSASERNFVSKFYVDLSPDSYLYAGASYDDMKAGQGMFKSYLVDAAGNTVIPPAATTNYRIDGTNVSAKQSDFLASTPSFESTKRYTAGYEGKLGRDTMLKIDLAYSELAYWYNSGTGNPTFDAGAGKSYSNPSDAFSGTAQFTFAQGEKQIWTVGLATRRDEASKKIFTLSNWRNADTKTNTEYDAKGTAITNSIFAQDEMLVRDNLTLYVGGRYDHWSSNGQAAQYIAPTFNTTYSKRTESSLTPKISAVFKPANAATLRASWGTAFRSPTVSELYAKAVSVSGAVTTTADSNSSLKPETATSWEFGGELQAIPSLLLKATYYENEIRNMIYLQTITQTATAINKEYSNAGRAKVKGLELGAAWKINSWLNLSTGYSITDSRMLQNDADPGSVGKRLTQVPERMGNVALEGSLGAWDGRVSGRYVSHVFSDEHNMDTMEGVLGSYDSVYLMDAKLSYKLSKQSKLSLSISNLLNKKYYAYYLMPERTYQVQLTTGF